MDINKIKAGEYQLLALRWDRQTSPPGTPFEFTRHERGETVKLTQEEARRLVSAGAVVTPGSIEKAEAERAAKQLKAALAQVPDEVRQQLIAELGQDRAHEFLTGTTSTESSAPAVERPTGNTSKAAWVAYAVSQGMEQGEAEKLSAAQLAAKYPAS